MIRSFQLMDAGARESVLKNDLFELRTALNEYAWDKQKAPRTLRDLVRNRYLRQIPIDPMTGHDDWQLSVGEPAFVVDPSEPGIVDVRSRSRYSDW